MQVLVDRPGRRRLDGYVDQVIAGLPASPVLLDQAERFFWIDVTHDDDGGLDDLADIGNKDPKVIADIIELGVPFSDPQADGIVNQLAAERALKADMSAHRLMDFIRDFRSTHDTAIVLFTYLNPVYAYGYEQFHTDAAAAGADGILLLDLPPDEVANNKELTSAEGLRHITLISPSTPPARVQMLPADVRTSMSTVAPGGPGGA